MEWYDRVRTQEQIQAEEQARLNAINQREGVRQAALRDAADQQLGRLPAAIRKAARPLEVLAEGGPFAERLTGWSLPYDGDGTVFVDTQEGFSWVRLNWIWGGPNNGRLRSRRAVGAIQKLSLREASLRLLPELGGSPENVHFFWMSWDRDWESVPLGEILLSWAQGEGRLRAIGE